MAKSRVEIKQNPKAIKLLESIAEDDVRTFGQLALGESRHVCPVAQIKGGTLKNSLEMEQEAPKVIALRSREDYGKWVHFGTSKMVARPFFAWGTDAAIPKFKSFINGRKTYRA